MARLIGERDGYVEGLEKVQVIFEDGSSKKVDKQMAFCKLSECGKNIKENTAMGANCNCNQPKLVHAQCIKIFRQKDGYNYCSKCEKTLDYAPVQLVAEQMSTEKKKSKCWTFFKMPTCISAPASPNANHSMQLNSKQGCCSLLTHTPGRANFSPKPVMAALTSVPAAGLSETFIRLRKQGKVALLPYVMAGDPNLSTTAEALKILDSCGSDIIELGVPYSDPLADGPVIQAAATRSLQGGTNFDKIISMLKDVTPQLSCPIALFTYYNPILKRGVEKFMDTLKDAGVQGLVVPDVPLEETEILRKEASKKKIELVLLTTPTTPTARMKSIVESSEGFVYLGVTGARESASHNGQFLLKQIKEATSKPVAVGFGISKPEHVKQVAAWGADGVIVGSAMARILGEAKSPEEGLKELQIFATSLKSAL